MGRSPATGEPIKIKASKKIVFRASKDLKEAVLFFSELIRMIEPSGRPAALRLLGRCRFPQVNKPENDDPRSLEPGELAIDDWPSDLRVSGAWQIFTNAIGDRSVRSGCLNREMVATGNWETNQPIGLAFPGLPAPSYTHLGSFVAPWRDRKSSIE